MPPERLWSLPTWLFSHLGTHAHRTIIHALGSAPVRTDYAVLAGLAQYGELSQAELGRRLGIYRSDLVAVLDRLQQDGLIARAPDPRDPRRNALRIMPAGRRRLRRLDTTVSEAQEMMMEPLDAAERTQLISLLQRLVQHHHGYEHAPGIESQEEETDR